MNMGQQTADSGQRVLAFASAFLLSAVCCLLSGQAAPPPKDSDLVAAAKKAKAGRVAIPRKPITNADVKKAKGKLIELPGKAPAANAPTAAVDQRTSMEKHDQARKAAAAAEKVQADAATKVAELEKELAAIEQSYYEENDPAYRDDVIRKKFDLKKQELEAARAALKE
jgi:hypothetical protein